MSKEYRYIRRIIGIFFIALFCFITFNNSTTLNVKAFSESDVITNTNKIDDGISTWHQISGTNPSNSGYVGSIQISNGVYLKYTFGSARDKYGNVTSGGDNTVATDVTKLNSGVYGAGYNYYSKINVFIDNHGKYNSIVHQGQDSYINGSPQKTSDSSFDYALVSGSSGKYYADHSVMGKMSPKVFMYGYDSNNRLVLKIAGYLASGPGARAYAEVVLRPSATGAPIVQRELYVYTPSGQVQFQPYFGEDTAMNDDSTIYDASTNTSVDAVGDDVPLYAIGGGQGLYINSAKNTSNSKSKLFVTNNVPGGFKNYMGIAFSSQYSQDIKGKPVSSNAGNVLTPNLKPGGSDPGDTDKAAGEPLLFANTQNGGLQAIVDANGRQNSAYVLRWDSVTLPAGSTGHYASTIGATISPYAVPIVTKTYTNSNQNSDGTNNVGDTLHFKLKVVNNGLNSHWNYSKLVDVLPKGLQLDQDSVKYVSTKSVSYGSGSNQYDKDVTDGDGSVPASSTTNNTINFTPNKVLEDKATYTVTFDATVTFAAGESSSLTNSASFYGNNQNTNGVALDPTATYNDSVKIPIASPHLDISFDKTLRNDTTNPNGSFSSSVDGKKGDTIEYKATIKPTGTDTVKSAIFNDKLPAGLELKANSVTVNGVAQSGDIDGINLGSIANNGTVTIGFKATVTAVTKQTATNIAVLNSIKTANGKTYNNFQSTSAILNIAETAPTMSFEQVPTSIDFGVINSSGSERILPNVKTDGHLVVDHTSDTPFQITVGYDNDNDDAIKNTGDNSKLIQDNDNAIYFNQNNNTNKENWLPLSASGIPIKDEGFSGSHTNYDLTNYIGLKQWRLRVPGTATSGQYSGKITWSMQDTLQ
ncbi:hypothetical protein CPEBRM1_ABPJDJAI_02011 [Companilactobacillus paralimentarius]|uniref:Ig-like domain-containing protein n=1 Tax=Companilactobacillus paralimentarius TaxID=83526 RepID=UPI00384E98D1